MRSIATHRRHHLLASTFSVLYLLLAVSAQRSGKDDVTIAPERPGPPPPPAGPPPPFQNLHAMIPASNRAELLQLIDDKIPYIQITDHIDMGDAVMEIPAVKVNEMVFWGNCSTPAVLPAGVVVPEAYLYPTACMLTFGAPPPNDAGYIQANMSRIFMSNLVIVSSAEESGTAFVGYNGEFWFAKMLVLNLKGNAARLRNALRFVMTDTALVNCGNNSKHGSAVDYQTADSTPYIFPALLLVVGSYITAPFTYLTSGIEMDIGVRGSTTTISQTTISPPPAGKCGAAGVCFQQVHATDSIYADDAAFVGLPAGTSPSVVEPVASLTWDEAKPTDASDLWLRNMGYDNVPGSGEAYDPLGIQPPDDFPDVFKKPPPSPPPPPSPHPPPPAPRAPRAPPPAKSNTATRSAALTAAVGFLAGLAAMMAC